MKKEELIFAMSEETNDFYEDKTCSSSAGGGGGGGGETDVGGGGSETEADSRLLRIERLQLHIESDEGCCVVRGGGGGTDTDAASGGSSGSPSTSTSGFIRRAKSTPNLLEIPATGRNRKKSDDSAVGSAEESESDKSSGDNSPTDRPLGDRIPPFHRSRSTVTAPYDHHHHHHHRHHHPWSPCGSSSVSLLRPPSVVVSDHDLYCQHGEETYLTLEELDADFENYHHRRRLSDSSTCSSLSFSELDLRVGESSAGDDADVVGKPSKWRTIRSITKTIPFLQSYTNKTKYPWIQLAGHQGNFKAGWQQGTVLKKFCGRERDCFDLMKDDPIKPYIPQYYGVVQDDGNEFIQLEDLLGKFNNPCVMDCKMGVRTYLEEELMKAKEKPKLRKDMYEKMCQIDPQAPTPEEHRVHGVTKPRYMVWRETISTTATLGFRIEGIRKTDGTSSKDFKTVRSEDKVKEAFTSFFDGYLSIIQKYLDRLKKLKTALVKSNFFATHEVIGSSLLFVHDKSEASVWMIDFAKTIRLPEPLCPIKHDKTWIPGNHEDGYLIGLSNLITIFEEILQNK